MRWPCGVRIHGIKRPSSKKRNQNMSEESLLREWIISIALHNETFLQQLLAHPKDALKRELGLNFSPEVQLYVHEETTSTIHLVIPALSSRESRQDVSVAELESATVV
jgi:short-subunit dehydrogenase involved in D-alanine esterification of teichoic acids